MRIINILGVSSLYLPIIIKYRSKRSLLVFLNGILFHINENNIYIRNYDIICNIIMCYYTYYNYNRAYSYILFSFYSFIINNILHTNNYISRNTSDVFHVLFVQGTLSVCLNKVKYLDYKNSLTMLR
jgi:hypothetical protein